MPHRQSEKRCIMPVSRILRDIGGTDDACAVEGWGKDCRIARNRKLRKLLPVDGGECGEKIAFSSLVDDTIEEGSKLRAAELQARIGCGLDDAFQVEGLTEEQTGLNHKFEFVGNIPRPFCQFGHISKGI